MPPHTALIELVEDNGLDPIRHDGDVHFVGTIRRGRSVTVGGALTVDGDVEADRFVVGGAMAVSGTVRGGEGSRVGGDLRCGALQEAAVLVRGDLLVRREIAGSYVNCGGRVGVPDGTVRGGDLSCNGGLVCRTLGDARGTPTIVEAGVGRVVALLEKSINAFVEERRCREEVMRCSIGPLLENTKALTPAQREKATEMLYQADELAAQTAAIVAAMDRRRRQTSERARPRVEVLATAHVGVCVLLDGAEFAVRSPTAGPVAITCRKTNGVAEIVAVLTADGAAAVLARAA